MEKITTRLDRIILHKFWGIPVFLAVIYTLFMITIKVGGSAMTLVESFVAGLLFNLSHNFIQNLPEVLAAVISGLNQGIVLMLSFIPVLGLLFFSLDFLNKSGYLVRGAMVMDRLMARLGLPGQSLVPMVIGFGCNVPAILGTNMLKQKEQRIITILMTPFMSCSARLAVYTVFVTVFFPKNGQNIIFSLYLIGIGVAIFTGFCLQKFLKTFVKTKDKENITELPAYKIPSFKLLLSLAKDQLLSFLKKASVIVIPTCIAINLLCNFNFMHNNSLEGIGRKISPIFEPMGIKEDNWPATISLITGGLGKELMLGSLNSLYLNANTPEENNIFNSEDASNSNIIATKIMLEKFGSSAAAYSYLLFVLLYFPCVSVLAAIAKELNKMWALASLAWTNGIAYTLAVLFYQLATISEHPFVTFKWCFAIALFYATCFVILRCFPAPRIVNYKLIPLKVDV